MTFGIWFSSRESTLKKEIDDEKASLQKSINVTSALITQKDEELEKLRNEVNAAQRGDSFFWIKLWLGAHGFVCFLMKSWLIGFLYLAQLKLI